MGRHATLLAMTMFLGAVPLGAAPVGRALGKGFGATDLKAIQPIIEEVLGEEAIGGARPWQGRNGTTGKVYLLSGGAKAGGACGRVRVTSIKRSVESKGYRFNFCRDAAGHWRTVG